MKENITTFEALDEKQQELLEKRMKDPERYDTLIPYMTSEQVYKWHLEILFDVDPPKGSVNYLERGRDESFAIIALVIKRKSLGERDTSKESDEGELKCVRENAFEIVYNYFVDSVFYRKLLTIPNSKQIA